MKTTTPGYGYNNNSNRETIGLDSNESWQDSINSIYSDQENKRVEFVRTMYERTNPKQS
ncbi:MAG: hypothetical protein JO327_10655 [Nitrososphaeraceae archaeon]|nr:hypothetical protein [Nitrososphaeraceae archaeon]